MLIYMIRHGQTDWNAEARLQGQKDIPLNALGRAQATLNGERLSDIIGGASSEFDFVASPLSRTRETMERLRAAMGLDPAHYLIDERLKEVSFGDWEGSTIEEIRQFSPDRVAARAASKWDFIPPGKAAESYEILSWRIGSWLGSLDRPTVCVSHGGVIRTIFRLTGGWLAEEASMAPTPQDRILRIDRTSKKLEWL